MNETRDVVYLADGKLFLVDGHGHSQPIESHFVRAAQQRLAESRDRNRFKSGAAWNVGMPAEMSLTEMPVGAAPVVVSRFTSLAPGASAGEIYYALQTDSMGGLFLLDMREDYERRLVHRPGLVLRGLSRHPSSGELACSIPIEDGTANIAVMNSDGGRMEEITGGDSVDESPNWIPGEDRSLLFQSAGIGRMDDGSIFGLGPYAICRIDIGRDSVHTVVMDEAFDYLSPRIGPDGSTFYIRRPYQLQQRPSSIRVLGDVVLFPFRVARSIVYFLDTFSRIFSNKPLMTAGGPIRRGPDRRVLRLWGRWVEINQKRHYARPNADPPLVPSSWTLVRREKSGEETSIANHVVDYEVADDGKILYSNGSAIYSITSGQKPKRMARARMIEQFAALSARNNDVKQSQ